MLGQPHCFCCVLPPQATSEEYKRLTTPQEQSSGDIATPCTQRPRYHLPHTLLLHTQQNHQHCLPAMKLGLGAQLSMCIPAVACPTACEGSACQCGTTWPRDDAYCQTLPAFNDK